MHFAAASFGDAVSCYLQALEALQQDPDGTVRLRLKIADCHRLHGDHGSALSALEQAFETALATGDPVALGRVGARRSTVLNLAGRYPEAEEVGLEAYQRLRESSENQEIGHLELALGVSRARRGDFAAARDYFERALSTFRRIDSEEGAALAYNNLGLVAKNSGDLEGALKHLEHALRINERVGNFARVTTHCLNLGIVKFKLGEWESAREFLERSLLMSRDTDDTLSRVSALNSLACLERRRRNFELSGQHLAESLRLGKERSHLREHTLALEFHGDLMVEMGRLTEAEQAYELGLGAVRSFAPQGDVALELLRRMADLHLRQGRLAEAEKLGREALELSRRQADRLEEATCWRMLALLAARRGDAPAFTALMDQALQQLDQVGERFELASTLYQAGRAERELLESGADARLADRAARHLRRACSLFVSFDCEYYLANTTLELARLDLAQGRLDQALSELEEALRDSGRFRPILEPVALELRSRIQEGYVQGASSPSNDFKLLEDVNQMFRRLPAREWGRAFVQAIADRLPADLVFLAERDGERWTLRSSRGIKAAAALDLAERLMPESPVARPVFSTCAARDEALPAAARQMLAEIGSMAVLPFGVTEHARGLLFVARSARTSPASLRQRDLDLLVALTNLAAVALVEANRQVLWEENLDLRERLKASAAADGIVTHNPQMLEILSLVNKVSDSSASVLIQGETGTGKGLIARAIHQRSARRDRPFVTINCAALPEPLLESELFGHVSGAFTGAHRDKRGLFEEAEGGTIFLDEVDRLSEAVQGKLLHVLDRGEIRAVGSNHAKQVNARVLCATNADLKVRISAGRFLEDLYYRLNDILIQVPPLRERREDIGLLADYFRHQFSTQFHKEVGDFSSEVRTHFLGHPWRGNVREMEKIVKRMVVLADPGVVLGSELLPEEFFQDSRVADAPIRGRLWDQVADTERRVIGLALQDAAWNKSRAARELGISYPALLQKIRTFGLDRRGVHKGVHKSV